MSDGLGVPPQTNSIKLDEAFQTYQTIALNRNNLVLKDSFY